MLVRIRVFDEVNRLATMIRLAVTHVVRWLSALRARVQNRIRRVQRPYEIVLTIVAIVIVLLFVYLLVANPFTQYGW